MFEYNLITTTVIYYKISTFLNDNVIVLFQYQYKTMSNLSIIIYCTFFGDLYIFIYNFLYY